MSDLQTIKVPDIGDFDEVEIIEVLVSEGDTLTEEQSIMTIESDKASMEIPSPVAGVITSLLVKTGDRVSTGNDMLVVDVAEVASSSAASGKPAADAPAPPASSSAARSESAPAPAQGKQASARTEHGVPGNSSSRQSAEQAAARSGDMPAPPAGDFDYQLVVLGAGPGGYTAAFRAADLGLKVLLIERYPTLGGVCLNVGCIPSKALLHTGEVIQETREMAAHGVSFGEPQIDIDKLRGFKEGVIGQLTNGLKGLARQRKVDTAHGNAHFTSTNELEIDAGVDGKRTVSFSQAIIAAGSQSVKIPGFPYDDQRLMDSTGALELADIPNRLLVIGGGIIGLEMGCVYAALGSKVTVVELSDGLMPGCDRDLVRPLEKRLRTQFENIYIGSKVTGMTSQSEGLKVSFEGGKAPERDTFDRVLLSVGRSPNGSKINAEAAGIKVDERGFIPVDSQQRTNVPHIFAIGDVVGQPMLAHKATHEGKTAAEVCAGHKAYFDAKTIPSVAYTDPEVAWMGLTETQARAEGISYRKGVFPWAASGRSLSMGRNEGLTKLLYDPDTNRLLGAGITGPNAGELIAEAVLALEMGADMEDMALSVHPHPTLSETLNFAAEVAEGTITDLYVPRA